MQAKKPKTQSFNALADLKQDTRNARRHNARNLGMIEQSIRQVGAARSGVIDENGVILAGNGTYEALAAAGIERIKVVQADGNEWVVVQRAGLTEEQKRLLALADNRAAELAEWHGPTLAEQGIDLAPWFSDAELIKIGAASATDDRHVEYARACVRDSLERGEAPLASHLLYTQPGILRDDVPAQRRRGIDAGLAWGAVADATVVYRDLGITPGMQLGIDHAQQAGRPVIYRELYGTHRQTTHPDKTQAG
jgi:hypothetical protein